jgi:hypothetical protein
MEKSMGSDGACVNHGKEVIGNGIPELTGYRNAHPS